jgi:hypothetical protein
LFSQDEAKDVKEVFVTEHLEQELKVAGVFSQDEMNDAKELANGSGRGSRCRPGARPSGGRPDLKQSEPCEMEVKVADVFSQDEMEDVRENFARPLELAERAAAALAGLRETAKMRRGERRRAACEAAASARRDAALMGLIETSLMAIVELVTRAVLCS